MKEKVVKKELVVKRVSLAKALKVKNRIVERLKEQLAVVLKYNVQTRKVEDTSPLATSVPARITSMVNTAFENYQTLKQLLTNIKIVIAKANTGIIDTIVSMIEAKSAVAELNTIPINIGSSTQSYGDNVFQSASVIPEEERRAIVHGIQQNIDKWQEMIDKYNISTEVEIVIDDDLITI